MSVQLEPSGVPTQEDQDQPLGGAFWTLLPVFLSVSVATSEQCCVRANIHDMVTTLGFP